MLQAGVTTAVLRLSILPQPVAVSNTFCTLSISIKGIVIADVCDNQFHLDVNNRIVLNKQKVYLLMQPSHKRITLALGETGTRAAMSIGTFCAKHR